MVIVSPSNSILETFSFKNKTPAKTIKIGAREERIDPSRAVVLSKPRKIKVKQRGIPKNPKGIIGKRVLRFSFSFLTKTKNEGKKIKEESKNLQKRKVKGGINWRVCFMTGPAIPQMIELRVRRE